MSREFLKYKYFICLISLLVWQVALKASSIQHKRQFLHDIVSSQPQKFQPVTGYQVLMFPTKARLQTLPISIRNHPNLAALSLYHSLNKQPRLYDLGVLDRKSKDSVVFIALKKNIPSWNRLYWVMMRVLSKEYSCFMREKSKSKSGMVAHCQDGRGVSFAQYSGNSWLGFEARRLSRASVQKVFSAYKKSNYNSQHLHQKWLRNRTSY